METTKHFGEHFRKRCENRKMLWITALTNLDTDTHKTSHMKLITRPLSCCSFGGKVENNKE